MGHRWNCPSDWEAEREARWAAQRDAESHWGKSYSDPYECDHANRAYRDEYDSTYRRREEELAEERRYAQRRAQQRAEEEEYERQCYEAAEQEAAMRAEEEAYWAALEAEAMSREDATQQLQGNAESPSSSDLNATGGISRPKENE